MNSAGKNVLMLLIMFTACISPTEPEPVTSGIYIMNSDGSNNRQIAAVADEQKIRYSSPSFTPDGMKIHFKKSTRNSYQVYEGMPNQYRWQFASTQIMNLNGSAIDLLVDGAAGQIQFNDDASLFTYSVGGTIYLKSLNSGVTSNIVSGVVPVISPDGTKIMYATSFAFGAIWSDIFIVNADGSDARILLHVPDDYLKTYNYYEFIPNSSRIIFELAESDSSGIYVINTDGTNIMLLANNAFVPHPINGGTEVLFSRANRDSAGLFIGSQIFKMNIDGSNQQLITDGSFINSSSDGSKILFTDTNTGIYSIYIINGDGTGKQLIMNNTSVREPRISPDGLKIVYTRLE